MLLVLAGVAAITRGSVWQAFPTAAVRFGSASAAIVPVADSRPLRRDGLARISRPGTGMLFVWRRPARPVFWMSETRFALALVWVRQGRVADVVRMAPCRTLRCRTWRAPFPVTAAVELPVRIRAPTRGEPITVAGHFGWMLAWYGF